MLRLYSLLTAPVQEKPKLSVEARRFAFATRARSSPRPASLQVHRQRPARGISSSNQCGTTSPYGRHGTSITTATTARVPSTNTNSIHARRSQTTLAADAAFHPQGAPGSIVSSIEYAAKLLPHQEILENFIHHNPLETLESLTFHDAINYLHKLEEYMSPGERVFRLLHADPRKPVNDAVVDLSSAFLDRGASKWAPRYRDRGFLYFFATHEGLGLAPWRKHARAEARRILTELDKQEKSLDCDKDSSLLAERILKEHLHYLGIPEEHYEHAIRSMLMELRGWAGMFHRMETHPREAPPNVYVRLIEFSAVQVILTRSSIEDFARSAGWKIENTSLAQWLNRAAFFRPSHSHEEEIRRHSSAIATRNQTEALREALENEFERDLLHHVGEHELPTQAVPKSRRPTLQLYTCIDDRECSLRRHVEEQSAPDTSAPSGQAPNPSSHSHTHPSQSTSFVELNGEIETFGVAGFFGIPIRYQPADGREQMILAPEGQNPSAVLVESLSEKTLNYRRRLKFFAQISRAWESASFSPLGSLILSLFAPVSLSRLLLIGFSPAIKHNIKNFYRNYILQKPQSDIQLPFSPEQAAQLLARTFRDVGTENRFAPIVVVLGHGSTSINNPFAAAYNCGACGGREGGPNARLLARMANDGSVRAALQRECGISIPDDTLFIGGMHNTTTDTIEYYDVADDRLPASHHAAFAKAKQMIEKARGQNALERCRRFLLAQNVHDTNEALRHVMIRSVDLAEVRPELNHATNAGVIIGRRGLTKGTFLDRRVFLPSYDPFSDDDQGTNLEHILSPALIVCSGINLEYLFSTIDADHHGAGTKAPLNIVGNIGVLQGASGDLRPGLPTQMTEMHMPVRAMYIVDAPIERVEAVLARRKELRQLVRNEWVRFFVRDPATGQIFRQSQGQYIPVTLSDKKHHQKHPNFVSEIVEDESAGPLRRLQDHLADVSKSELTFYRLAYAGMILSCALPVGMYGFGAVASAMNPAGALIAICGTALALPVLAFSRRYLHGEFMFARFSMLSTALLLGFNLVATAPTLEHVLVGWSLFGFASTFLIGAYNDRSTVRNNATFAFAAYRISDFAMIVAAALSAHYAPLLASGMDPMTSSVVAGALLLAALFKSSQFPLTSLFVRSMEGPTPASALGYAGLSAHVGVVLLSSTMPLWFGLDWARMVLGGVGLSTAVYASLVSKIRADRKGAIANATSATIGLIFGVLALGYPNLALLLSLGHASFRMIQILRAPNMIADSQNLRSALGFMPWPRIVPDWLYKLSWTLRRIDSDFHLLHVLHLGYRPLHKLVPKSWKPHKNGQWLTVAACLALAGVPFTPVSEILDHTLMELLPTHPAMAAGLMAAHFALSVVLIRFLFLHVLNPRRFHKTWSLSQPATQKAHGTKATTQPGSPIDD